MKNLENRTGKGTELRRLAEETIKKGLGMPKDHLDATVSEDTRLVFHELYLHQIELEMQNEELRRIQGELDRERARYRDLYDLAPVGYCTISAEGRIMEVNSTLAEMLGLDRAKVLDQPFSGFIHYEDQDLFHFQPKKAHSTCCPQVCELRLIRHDGTVFWAHLATAAARNAGASMECGLVISDITGRKEAEQALRRQEEQYRRIVETSLEGIWVLDKNWQTTYANGRLAELLGYTPEEMVDKRAEDFVFAEDALEHAFRLQKRRQGLHDTYECRLRHRDGHEVWVLVAATSIMDEQDEFDGSFAMFTDITARRQAEEALRQSEHQAREAKNFLTLILDTVPVRLFWKDLTSVYLGCNRLFAEDSGLQVPEEVIGLDDFSMAWKDEAELYRSDDRKIIAAGKAKLHYEEVRTAPDGRQVTLLTSKVPLRDAEGSVIGILGTYEDITLRKWAEEELLKARKLEAAGLLIGGIAHDFNNILMVVMGNIAFAKMQLAPTDQAYERLTVAEGAALKAKELTQQFLTFAKGGAPVKRPVPPARVIRTYSRLALTGSASTCATSFADELWEIDADEAQIGQAVANILINADQSMEGGGTISIRCENAQLGEDSGLPLPAGNYVKVVITDQGTGIPEDHIARIFDPYFTTKQSGRGFGLAAAYAIVRKHLGIITVQSAAGTGTAFTLLLPAAASRTDLPSPEPPISLQGSGKVLIMDDEMAVYQITGAMLANLGYEAEYAHNGEEALAKYRTALEGGQPYAAVILDLTVPEGMGGMEAIRRLLELDPGARAIVSSGYSSAPAMTRFQDYGFKGMIAKPYHQAELGRRMQEVLSN